MDGHADHPQATTLAVPPPASEPAVTAGVLADPELSFAAKGLLLWALTRPPGQELARVELDQASRDPLHALTDALHNLVRSGWLATVPAGQPAEHAEGFMVRVDADEADQDPGDGDQAAEEPAPAGVGKGVIG